MLAETGYHILPKLSKEKCDRILERLAKLTFQEWNGKHKVQGFDFDGAISNRYETKDQRLVYAIPEIYEISHDPHIIHIIEGYLGAKPIQTQADCWWSVNHNPAETGQEFHQDFTYGNFIKMYLYLSDVTMENGPHVYVPGSKNRMVIPEGEYHPNTRVSDEFIKKNYSRIKYFTGDKGTMMLVDTRGYHKGLPVISGHRILIQFEFADDATDLVTGQELIYI